MTFLTYFDFSLSEFLLILFIVFIASIIRGFNGFGFSATCISGFSFILPAIQIVPIILILEVFISIFMIPYIWNKIDWNFVFKLLIEKDENVHKTFRFHLQAQLKKNNELAT